MNQNSGQPPLAFEEFKLFYESAEKVTERRLAANRWNYSICTAILVAVIALARLGTASPTLALLSAIGMLLLCLFAALYCSLWIGQIRDFKSLNNAKFGVLEGMAPRVRFSHEAKDPRVSGEPFKEEWAALQKQNALQEAIGLKIVALKSSNIEYVIPRAFRVVFPVLSG